MNIRQLEVFHAIMAHGSVTEAARALNVSQPSVSSVLKHAEQTLRVRLFERIGGRLLPTPEAELLFPEVEQIHEQLARVEKFARDLRVGSSGRLSLIANPTLASSLLPLAIARFRARFPAVRVRLQTDIPAGQIADRIVRREFDLGFAYGPILDVHVGVATIGRSSLVVALRRDHKLARKRTIGPRDLKDAPIISFGAGSPIRLLAEAVFADAGCEFNPVVAASFSAAACALAQEAAGLAIIDQVVLVAESFPGLVFRPLATARHVELNLIYPGNRPRSMLSTAFAEMLQAVTEQYEREFRL